MTAITPEDTIRGQILHLLVSLGEGSSSSTIGPSLLFTEMQKLHPDLTESALGQHVKLLEDRGFVNASWNAGGLLWLVSPTSEGRELAAAFAHDREDPVKRVRQLQDDYLEWLYIEIEHNDGAPTPDRYLATNPSYLGIPYTAKELLKAGSRLRDAAYITGQGAWQYDAPLRPELTAKGRHTIESNRSVHDPQDHGARVQNIHTNVAGNANVAVGDNATQTFTVNTVWADEVTSFLDAVAQAAATMPEDVRADIAPHVDDARQGVAEQEPSKVRKAVEALRGFLSAASSGALGNILAAQIPVVLGFLP